MLKKLVMIYSAAWRGLVVLFAVEISIVSALRYVTGSEPAPPPILANAFANSFLVIHVVGGVVALLVGPLQFVGAIRTRWPAFHRATGYLFVAACAIGAPTGLLLALGTTAGPVAAVGFAMPALLWPAFTWFALRAAMERRFASHREWMLRAWAMPSAAITLRLMLPAAGLLGLDFFPAYRVISWAAWLVNLALVEYLIRRTRAPGRSYARLATA
jgi:hypothetical protein